MALRLYPESKRALLEQSLRVQTDSDLFIKLLTVNRSFINVGRYYKITQLVIEMSWFSRISIFFGIDDQTRTKRFEFSVEQTRQIIELFQIQMLKIDVSPDYNDRFPEYWSLIECFEGKVEVQVYGVEQVELINRFWHKITSLRAPSYLFSLHQPSKHFDKLSVVYVQSIDDLKHILRHDVDELEIDYIGDLSMHEVQKFLETAPKTNIKKCKLYLSGMLGEVDINVIVPLVECIVGVSSMCQNMEISIKIDSRYIASDMDQLVDKIASAYETFTKAKNLLLALPFKLELSAFASFDTTLRYDNSKDNWLDIVKQKKPEFSNGVYEVKINGRRVSDKIVIQSVDKTLKSTFTLSVDYSY